MPVLLNAYCTHKSPPEIDFPHRLRNRRDRGDPELAGHLNGFMGFVMDGGKRPMNQTRFHVLGHLERVRHQVALEVEQAQIGPFEAWSTAANAIIFTPDGAIRSPNGAVLVHPETGDAQPEAYIPRPADAEERKAATDRRLSELGIPFAESLPPVASEVEVELRDIRTAAQRCLALFACALRAESLAQDKPISTKDLEQRVRRGFAGLSPKERAFMNEPSPSKQDIVEHAWRYEAIATLAWSVGAVPDLPFPETTCDTPAIAKAMFDVIEKPFAPKPRTPAEVLDALDLHYRLHWATTDARVHGKPPPNGVEPGVVAERHYALNWLTRFQEADWDDVDTPT